MDQKETDKAEISNDLEAAKLNVTEDANNDDVIDLNQLPPAPDGGYGWVIVFASFICNCIVDGIVYSFGIFLDDFSSHFDVGKGTMAWAGSLLSGVYMCVGPIVSALANKYGCRAVCIAGSILGALAFTLSTLCTSVSTFFIIYGIVGGTAFGLIYLPAIVFVGYYFDSKRSLATGIAVCGSGFGAFIFGQIAPFLLNNLSGWKSANLVLACIILICFVCGGMAALFVPFFYIVDSANKEGIENSSSLISIIGLTNTFGRIACGYVADFPAVNSLFLNNICLCLCAVALAIIPLVHTFYTYMGAAILFGIGLAGYMSLTSIILVDLLGLDKLTNAFGLLILFRGTAAIFGAPLIGSIYDSTQSYAVSFYAAGGLFALSAFFSFMAPVAVKFKKR